MNRKLWLILIGVAMVAFDVVGILIMRNTGGPGILAFEFAASKARAAQIMAEWGKPGRDAARLSLWVDFGFLLSYGAFFTLAGIATRDLARARGWRRLAIVGAIVPFFAAVAAVLDASENVALLITLAGHGGSFAPLFATICSTIKFTLITVAILYVLCGLAWRARTRAELLAPS
jgi:hypothetical protein